MHQVNAVSGYKAFMDGNWDPRGMFSFSWFRDFYKLGNNDQNHRSREVFVKKVERGRFHRHSRGCLWAIWEDEFFL